MTNKFSCIIATLDTDVNNRKYSIDTIKNAFANIGKVNLKNTINKDADNLSVDNYPAKITNIYEKDGSIYADFEIENLPINSNNEIISSISCVHDS